MAVLTTTLAGNQLTCSVTFTTLAGTPTDPTGVTFSYEYDGSDLTDVAWNGSSSSSALNTVWRTGTGTYSALIGTTSAMAPVMNVAFAGSGAIVATVAGVVQITTSPALP